MTSASHDFQRERSMFIKLRSTLCGVYYDKSLSTFALTPKHNLFWNNEYEACDNGAKVSLTVFKINLKILYENYSPHSLLSSLGMYFIRILPATFASSLCK